MVNHVPQANPLVLNYELADKPTCCSNESARAIDDLNRHDRYLWVISPGAR